MIKKTGPKLEFETPEHFELRQTFPTRFPTKFSENIKVVENDKDYAFRLFKQLRCSRKGKVLLPLTAKLLHLQIQNITGTYYLNKSELPNSKDLLDIKFELERAKSNLPTNELPSEVQSLKSKWLPAKSLTIYYFNDSLYTTYFLEKSLIYRIIFMSLVYETFGDVLSKKLNIFDGTVLEEETIKEFFLLKLNCTSRKKNSGESNKDYAFYLLTTTLSALKEKQVGEEESKPVTPEAQPVGSNTQTLNDDDLHIIDL
jgi:hypothetical protein